MAIADTDAVTVVVMLSSDVSICHPHVKFALDAGVEPSDLLKSAMQNFVEVRQALATLAQSVTQSQLLTEDKVSYSTCCTPVDKTKLAGLN